MTILHLTDEQIRGWTREQKDRWWFENVYRGDMPQLTLRSAATGLHPGRRAARPPRSTSRRKTGIGIGVGLTSVILAFAIYRDHALAPASRPTSPSSRTTARSRSPPRRGYMMHADRSSSLAAYMLVTRQGHRPMVRMIVVDDRGRRSSACCSPSRSSDASSTRSRCRSRKDAPPAWCSTRSTRGPREAGLFKAQLLGVHGGSSPAPTRSWSATAG